MGDELDDAFRAAVTTITPKNRHRAIRLSSSGPNSAFSRFNSIPSVLNMRLLTQSTDVRFKRGLRLDLPVDLTPDDAFGLLEVSWCASQRIGRYSMESPAAIKFLGPERRF